MRNLDTSEMLFIQDNYNNKVLVAKRTWFSNLKEHDLFDDYGLRTPCNNRVDFPHAECTCDNLVAYNYWNGSNFASIVVESSSYDATDPYSIITDEEEIASYRQALENMQYDGEHAGVGRFISPGFLILQSYWQGGWELYQIIREDSE